LGLGFILRWLSFDFGYFEVWLVLENFVLLFFCDFVLASVNMCVFGFVWFLVLILILMVSWFVYICGFVLVFAVV